MTKSKTNIMAKKKLHKNFEDKNKLPIVSTLRHSQHEGFAVFPPLCSMAFTLPVVIYKEAFLVTTRLLFISPDYEI